MLDFAAFLLIIGVTLFSAALTFVSGFGLGTILLPAFVIFFPIHIAVAMTAIVHLTNNIFKFGLMHGHVDWEILKRFGIPAIVAAALGAFVLAILSHRTDVLWVWHLGNRECTVTPVKLAIGCIVIGFAFFEVLPMTKTWRMKAKWLPLGGVLSGFFGGLSGHQGALRSVFLLRAGMSKEAFIATGIAVAVLVDFGRLFIYGAEFDWRILATQWPLILAATLSAIVGTLVGRRILHKVTMPLVEKLVFLLLLLIGLSLVFGII